ncbi:hypothetical protein [Microbacterium sp. SGAir0570]|uniref:hypothetical protein n=1 Tax=Microbacterium sp. SGAir0570 TaxID=2070348 RepID=UPI0015E853EC|nr:hypothetical protein [Microbacterium sp. SGAir0570]
MASLGLALALVCIIVSMQAMSVESRGRAKLAAIIGLISLSVSAVFWLLALSN